MNSKRIWFLVLLVAVSWPAIGIELGALDGGNGFVIHGVDRGDNFGISVSDAGDINGDGIDDLIIGSSRADPAGIETGSSYVMFGRPGLGNTGVVELSSLNGTNGFALPGAGTVVAAAGDVNDDGLDDVLIANPPLETNGVFAGAIYVVFGGTSVGTGGVVDLTALDGTDGFVLIGAAASDFAGGSIGGGGDVNGDGVDDLIIGAAGADPNGSGSGASYVVFGRAGLGSTGLVELSALDGTDGFVMNGIALGDAAGTSVTIAGDLNADGIDELVVGAWYADPHDNQSGACYVVFGNAGLGGNGVLELSSLDGSNGFVVNGIAFEDFSGNAVSRAGDVNEDGVADLLIGAYRSDANGFESGAAYVVFGGTGLGSSGVLELSVLDGSNGYAINGFAANDFTGGSLSPAGDVNRDGVDDLLIGAHGSNANGYKSGASYVVYGGSAVGSNGVVELAALDDASGLVLTGAASKDYSGRSVSTAGDVNADGADDIIVGAWMADTNGSRSGDSYVVFGNGPGPGALVTGASGERAACINARTNQTVSSLLEGRNAWDCDEYGLLVRSGDSVDTVFEGIAGGAAQFAGTAFGFSPAEMIIVCFNSTTGQGVSISNPGGTGWNCEAAGLTVSDGDAVKVFVRGTAK